jgi:uncharacterized protein YacL
MDFGKCAKAALMPTIGLSIVFIILDHFQPPTVVAGQPLGIQASIIFLIVYASWILLMSWAGFKAVKEQKLDLAGGALAGLITGAASTVVNSVVVLLSLEIFSSPGSMIANTISGIIPGMVIGAVVGAILGVIGALVARRIGKVPAKK